MDSSSAFATPPASSTVNLLDRAQRRPTLLAPRMRRSSVAHLRRCHLRAAAILHHFPDSRISSLLLKLYLGDGSVTHSCADRYQLCSGPLSPDLSICEHC